MVDVTCANVTVARAHIVTIVIVAITGGAFDECCILGIICNFYCDDMLEGSLNLS